MLACRYHRHLAIGLIAHLCWCARRARPWLRAIVDAEWQFCSKVSIIEAEDALIAALRAKHENPDAVITYVAIIVTRMRNCRREESKWDCSKSLRAEPCVTVVARPLSNIFGGFNARKTYPNPTRSGRRKQAKDTGTTHGNGSS
jgi:hypothetical protein